MRQQAYAEIQTQFPISHLHGLAMFGALSEECVRFLLERGEIGFYQSGEQLFVKDSESDGFYVVLSGDARFYKPKADEERMVGLRCYGPGEQIGFVGMIGLQKRYGNAVMETDGYVLKVPVALFHDFCERFPEEFKIILINITREMSREIADLDTLCTELK